MGARPSGVITEQQVRACAESWLCENLSLQDAGWKCTARVVWGVLLVAAARMTSIFAACRDWAGAPSDDAVGKALGRWLPKRTQTLEEWFAPVLAGQSLPRVLFRKSWVVAIDWHAIAYHGEPQRWSNELRHGKPKSGTTKSHTYATACIVHKGFRYTLAVTSVKKNASAVEVLERLLDRLATLGIRVKTLLLDRQFCTSAVMATLQARQTPYLMPLMLRGRKPKKDNKKKSGTAPRTLRDFLRQAAGRYQFTWSGPQQGRPSVTFDVIVGYKSYRDAKTDRRRSKKLLFAAWRVSGSPTELRQLYRCRFAIESSYRQLGQARIRTSTRSPVQRLLFVLIAFLLRNLWIWLHWTYFRTGPETNPTLHPARLRFRQLLTWIDHALTHPLHPGVLSCT